MLRKGCSRSSKIIVFGNIRKRVRHIRLVIISNLQPPNLHRFVGTATSMPKIAAFFDTLSLKAFSDEILDESHLTKTTRLAVTVSEDFEIQACVLLIQYRRVTDRQTDTQTDMQTPLLQRSL